MDVYEIREQIQTHARGMWRYRWHALGIAWLISVAGWFLVSQMPDVYEATAKVSVDTNSMLPELTRGLTANEDLISEVDIVSKALLTRPNLEKVARRTDLDLRAETADEMEALITGLQSSVKIRGGGRDKVFSISFKDSNQQKATEFVASLLDAFVESSLGARGDDSDMTQRALASEIKDHEDRLVRAEADLAEFKKRNIGYMPDDGADYYTRLQTAMAAVDASERETRQLQQRRDEISRQLRGEASIIQSGSGTSSQQMAVCSNAAQTGELRAQLSALQVDFTDKHPRIVMIRDTIATLEARCEEEISAIREGVLSLETSTATLDQNPVYQNLRLLLSNADVELAALQERLRTEQREVAQLRNDVDKIADVETEFKRLNRDYGVVESRHQELLRRWETLQSKNRLDPFTGQVQFNILEPPFASTSPVAPNRPLLVIGVLIVALGIAVVASFALDQLNVAYFTKLSVTRAFDLPVLGSISMIYTPQQLATKRRGDLALAGAALSLFAACGLVVYFEGQIVTAAMTLLGVGS
jgi:polysaccharide chain length determinant protein (PEP-CTERM system associated)